MTAGPRVVAIGGGHGTAVTLRAARTYAGQLTAIVSTADDGGSSGRLRDVLSIPALGDLRKCLGALASPESSLAPMLEVRYGEGPLEGHAMGNLWLAGLLEETGSLLAAVERAGELLEADGLVLPATSRPTELHAVNASGAMVGQAAIGRTSSLRHVSLLPREAEVPSAAFDAISNASQVLIGPGSLFTSVLAAAVAPGIVEALRDTDARVIFISNLQPQFPETAGFTLADHLEALERHHLVPDLVLWDPSAGLLQGELGVVQHRARLAGPNGLVHDPVLLAQALSGLV